MCESKNNMTHTHLIAFQFSSQAVQAVEDKFPVQLIAGVADKPANNFSLCFEMLPGAECGLEVRRETRRLYFNALNVSLQWKERHLYKQNNNHQALFV